MWAVAGPSFHFWGGLLSRAARCLARISSLRFFLSTLKGWARSGTFGGKAAEVPVVCITSAFRVSVATYFLPRTLFVSDSSTTLYLTSGTAVPFSSKREASAPLPLSVVVSCRPRPLVGSGLPMLMSTFTSPVESSYYCATTKLRNDWRINMWE